MAWVVFTERARERFSLEACPGGSYSGQKLRRKVRAPVCWAGLGDTGWCVLWLQPQEWIRSEVQSLRPEKRLRVELWGNQPSGMRQSGGGQGIAAHEEEGTQQIVAGWSHSWG